MPEEREHAILSASGAHKWLICAPSARLEEKFPNKTSDYMAEGTLAHEIAEFKVRNYFLGTLTKTAYTRGLNKFKKEEKFDNEMMGHTDLYLEYLKGEALKTNSRPFIEVELKVDFSKYVPEGFGTADCVMISGDTMHIIDFKYGKGVKVEAKNNPQMKLYALGTYEQFSILYPITKVRMTIIQPRLDNISEAEISLNELLEWGENIVKPQAQNAFLGIGNYVCGEHCRFCKAKGACEFRTDTNMKIIQEIQNTTGIVSNEKLGEVLTKTEGIEGWIKDIKTYALEQVLSGKKVPGWKAVEGKSNRKIVDIDKAFEILKENGFGETILYERQPLELTALEKVVGKSELTKLISNYIEKPKGAPTLAKESDKRELFKVSAAEEFKNESEEN